jgi:ABC-type branched-subunit amino acid transport system ATPase component
MELFNALTVRQNVEIGREAGYASWNPASHLLASPKQRHRIERSAGEALELCGLLSIQDSPVGTLSTGQRRLVELARCLAGPFEFLLLDEPSSGLDHAETERFADILRTVARERNVGILIVEHDVKFVTNLSEHIYVVDFGKLIFEGAPRAVLNSKVVRLAYLGDSELANTESLPAEVVR